MKTRHSRWFGHPAQWLMAAAVWTALPAWSATYTFPGSLPAGCSGSGGSYTCSSLTLGFGDVVVIASPKPATITVTGAMSTNNAQINASGSAADLTLSVGGALTVGYQANINANVTAASVSDASGQVRFGGTLRTTSGGITLGYQTQVAGNVTSAGGVTDGSGQVTFGGSITTTTGAVAVGYASTVAGGITTTTGAVTLESSTNVNGSITSTSGAVQVNSSGRVGGAISTTGAVTLGSSVTVVDDVVGATGAISVGYAATVGGVVTSTSGTISFSGNNSVSSCVASRSSAAITLGFGSTAGGVCCGAACGTSCVTNNSGQAMPSSCALITYVASTTSSANSATITLAKPAGVTAGDVMLASIAQRSSQLPLGSYMQSVPTGWTLVLNASDGSAEGLLTYRKVVTASDPASFSWTMGSSGRIAGGIAAFRGVDNTNPVNVSNSVSNGTASTSYTAPSVTTTTEKTMLVAVFSAVNGNGTVSAAADMTSAFSIGSLAGPNGIVVGVSYANQVPAGATGTRTSSGNSSLTNLAGSIALTPAVSVTPTGPDHYELSLPTSSINCLSSTVTVTACATSATPCASPYTAASGGTATLSTTGATLASTSVTFNSSGVATTTLSYPTAADGTVATVTLSGESVAATNARQCCPNGTSCSAANSCSTTFNTAGFIVASSTGGSTATVPTQTAGTSSGTYYLRAVQTSTTTGACTSALTGSTTVNWAAQCNNPTTCSAGSLMTLIGNSATAIAGNANGSTASSTSVAMTFDASGNAPFSFNYADVGQLTLYASKAASGSLLSALSGSTNAFVVKPAALVLSNIKQTASPQLVNPAAASATGSKFVKAGEAFTGTVTAQTSGGAATPNFGKETTPEGVTLTPTLLLPSGGAAGTLGNGTVAGGSFSSGAATVTTLSYSEVGIISLTPSLTDGSYLGAGSVTGTASGNVGRFYPAQFALSSPSVTHRSTLACSPASTFSHLGENFRFGLTLTAQNASGATTQNYTASFAKLDPTLASGWNLAGRDGTTVFNTGNGRLSLGTATGSFSNGVASSITMTANAPRQSTVDAPFSAVFGVAPVDSDGVAMASFDLASASGGSNDLSTVGTVALRFGRLRLSSAIGAADRTLTLPATVQYWNGSAWDTNTLDSCTTVATTAVNFGNLRKTLTSADLSATSAITVVNGVGTLKLGAPGGGRSGTYDVALSLGSATTDASCLQTWTPTKAATTAGGLAYLRGAWCGSSLDKDPSARASFGLQRTQEGTLYRRESY